MRKWSMTRVAIWIAIGLATLVATALLVNAFMAWQTERRLHAHLAAIRAAGDPASISEGQSFVDDLEADSLALIELVEALEEELAERSVGFRIEDEDLEDLKSVRDAVDYVYDRVQGS